MFNQLSRTSSLEPRLTVSKLLAFLLSLVVQVVNLGIPVLGFWLLIFGIAPLARILSIFGGLFCLLIAWVSWVRFAKLPKEGVVSRPQCPVLYKLVDQVTRSLRAKPVDYIVIGPLFNASMGEVGWRRKRILYLGLPLFAVLDRQERIALLGHEIAHSVNGDPTRNFLTLTAIYSLVVWFSILWGMTGAYAAGFFLALLLPSNWVLYPLAGLAWLGAYSLVHLLWWDSQRAEYLADFLAATVGGTEAMLALLEKLCSGQTFDIALQHISFNPDFKDQDFFDLLRQRIVQVPAREVQRIKRVEQLAESRLDTTHPPTPYRIALLQTRPALEPKVVLSPAENDAIDSELLTIRSQIQKQLVSWRRAGIF
ncbi:MAG: M48 family metallopeptidase [Chloroflexi bacterium]|nr:M48 family metallopeptidase [Chloroflexota bacterium]MCI0581167.1 M48 family metallopeptidase [Chloroflexota bacterium]